MADDIVAQIVEAEAKYRDLTNADLEKAYMKLQKSLTQLSNKRSQEGTLADTLESYGIQLEKSRKILAESRATQAERCRKDTPGNGSFSFHPGHDDAKKFLDDHNGDQETLKNINAHAYNMILEEYETERDAKREEIANIVYELAQRDAVDKYRQADAAHAAEIQRILKYNSGQEISELPF